MLQGKTVLLGVTGLINLFVLAVPLLPYDYDEFS